MINTSGIIIYIMYAIFDRSSFVIEGTYKLDFTILQLCKTEIYTRNIIAEDRIGIFVK